MHQCPDCKGKRQLIRFCNTGLDSSKHYAEMRDCPRCLGAGYVSQDVIDSIQKGKGLRRDRQDRGFSLLEMARFEGVSVATISRREQGYFPN